MSKLLENCIMVVKYSNNGRTSFCEYRCNKGRNLNAIMRYFRAIDSFRFAVIYQYNRQAKQRGSQLYYFDRNNLK